MIDHDRLFKELISTFLLEFIELFFPEVRVYIEEGSLDFLDKEIFTDVTSGERHEVDLVAKVRFAGKDAYFLVHVENQAQPQSNFAERMFTYFARLTQKYRLPVYPIALLTYSAPVEEHPDSYIVEFPDRVVLRFQFRVVQLNRLDWREFARRENPVASALMARMNIAPGDRHRVKLECVRLLSTFKLAPAKMQLIMGLVDTYLRLNDAEEGAFQSELGKLAPAEKEKVMEVTMSWREAALAEGMQKGLEQGKQQLILRLIGRRLGPIDVPVRQRISELDSSQLERLADALLDFADAGELVEWLQNL
jgi:hypothetical protein